MNGLLTGTDAIDVARMSGVQLHRAPAHAGDTPDTSWVAAEAAIKAGDAELDDFYIDLDFLPTGDAGTIILCLIAVQKAWHDLCSPKL